MEEETVKKEFRIPTAEEMRKKTDEARTDIESLVTRIATDFVRAIFASITPQEVLLGPTETPFDPLGNLYLDEKITSRTRELLDEGFTVEISKSTKSEKAEGGDATEKKKTRVSWSVELGGTVVED